MPVRFIFSLLIVPFLVTTFLVLPTNASAVTQTSTYISPGSPAYANQLVINVIHVFSCMAEGRSIIGQPCTNYAVTLNNHNIPQITQTNNSAGGAMGMMTNGIIGLSLTRPVSGVHYIAEGLQNYHLIEPAYAQVTGTGANLISPIEKLWQTSRNIAYLALIIVFLIIGLMIMFRQKINPQTVISAQQALPGVVTTLILITFSYLIAGLIIDLGYLLAQVFGIVVVSSLTPTANPTGIVQNALNDKNVFNYFNDFIQTGDLFGAAGEIGKAVANVFSGAGGEMILGIIGGLAGLLCLPTGLATPLCVAAGTGIGSQLATNTIIPFIVYLVLLIALLSAMFRLFFALIGAFVGIVLHTIFAPFILLMAAIPGRGGSAIGWARNLLGNVLVFPVVFGLFVIVAAILGFNDTWGFNTDTISNFGQSLPVFGGLPGNFIRYILAYGLLMAAPGIPDHIKQAVGGAQSQHITRAISGSTGAGGSMVTKTFGTVTKLLPKP